LKGRDAAASLRVHSSDGNVNRYVEVLHTIVDLIAHRFLCHVIDVHAVDGGFDARAKVHGIDESAHLIRQSGFKFVRDYVSNDIGKVGLIERDRAERSVLLLGEVCIHKGKLIPPRMGGKGNFQYILSPRKIKTTIFSQVGTINEGSGLLWCGKMGVRH